MYQVISGQFLKFISRRSPDGSERPFEREFKAIQLYEPISHSHESLVSILHIGREGASDCFYYVMELADDAEGRASPRAVESKDQGLSGAAPSREKAPATLDVGLETLDSRAYAPRTLRHDLKYRGRLPVEECIAIGVALATALEQLHRNKLVHRDIKPSNIIFVRGRPKLADIGLVTDSEATRSCVGTDGYIPPEGQGKPPSDLYALGKVLYEMSTGCDRQDFPALPAMDTFPPEERDRFHELNAILLKACENDVSKRYTTATAMRDDLILLQAGKSVRRNRLLEQRLKWAVIVAVITAILGVIGFYIQEFKASAALEKVKQAELREQTQRRQLLIQQLQMTRMTPHRDGWSASVLDKVRQVASSGINAQLRNQAVATLSGLDARLIKLFTNFSATSVAFDRDGQQLLIGGLTEGAKLWNPVTDELHISHAIGPGPVAFAGDGTPLHFIAKGQGRFVLWDVAKQKNVREFEIASPLATGSWPEYVEIPTAIHGRRFIGRRRCRFFRWIPGNTRFGNPPQADWCWKSRRKYFHWHSRLTVRCWRQAITTGGSSFGIWHAARKWPSSRMGRCPFALWLFTGT